MGSPLPRSSRSGNDWSGSSASRCVSVHRTPALRAGPRCRSAELSSRPPRRSAPRCRLIPDRSISPSLLEHLLQCPPLFLLGNLRRLHVPAGPPPQRELGQQAYGALVHRAPEAFHREHGEALRHARPCQSIGNSHIPSDLVVTCVTAQRKPPEVRIWRLRNQSRVGTVPPSTSTPHRPACLERHWQGRRLSRCANRA